MERVYIVFLFTVGLNIHQTQRDGKEDGGVNKQSNSRRDTVLKHSGTAYRSRQTVYDPKRDRVGQDVE